MEAALSHPGQRWVTSPGPELLNVVKEDGAAGRPHGDHRDRREIDLVISDRRTGAVAAVEVKLTATLTARHARHLAWLRDQLGPRLRVGLLLHADVNELPLGDRIWALPYPSLWRAD